MWHALKAAGLLVSLAAAVTPTAAQAVWYVDADATGAETGQSWDDAFTDLQDALAAAEASDEVWVAEGTYRPTDGSDRTISFVLPSGVALYGGFDGTEQSLDERDWTKHEVILSGDVGVPGDSTDNSYHVVVANGVDNTSVLDGFTVQHGMGRGGDPPHDRGAGVLAIGGSPTLRNDYFFQNLIGRPVGGLKPGGALYAEDGAPLIEDCVFEGNGANRGGGAYFTGSDPVMRRVTLWDNSAGQLFFEHGSRGLVEDVLIEDGEHVGIFIIGSSPRFLRVTIRDNRLDGGDGGGAIIDDGAAPVFEDCLFEGNRAERGAAIQISSISSALFLRTTFRDNVASSDGAVSLANSSVTCLFCRFERNRGLGTGGLFALGSAMTILASTFVGNTASWSESGGGALLFTGSTFTGEPVVAASSLFVGNEANEGGAVAAFGVGPGEALVVNSTFAGNEAREAGGALYASNASGLEIQNSVLWGNEAPVDNEVHVAEGAPLVITQSIVKGGYPSGTNILDQDPLFVRMPDPGPDGNWGTADDDYGDLRLLEGSPAVDYGLEAYLPADTWDLDGDGDTTEPLPIDIDGNARIMGQAPDLGAYEGAVRVANEPTQPPAEDQSLRIWPNPASTTLHVEAPDADEAVVYDVLGREVLRLRLDGITEADVLGLAPGVYVVRAGGQAAVVTVRR